MLWRGNLVLIKSVLALDIQHGGARWHKGRPVGVSEGVAIRGTPFRCPDVEKHGAALGAIWTRCFATLTHLHESDLRAVDLCHSDVVGLENGHSGAAFVVTLHGGAREAISGLDALDDSDAGVTVAVEGDARGGVEGGLEGATFAFEGRHHDLCLCDEQFMGCSS